MGTGRGRACLTSQRPPQKTQVLKVSLALRSIVPARKNTVQSGTVVSLCVGVRPAERASAAPRLGLERNNEGHPEVTGSRHN